MEQGEKGEGERGRGKEKERKRKAGERAYKDQFTAFKVGHCEPSL